MEDSSLEFIIKKQIKQILETKNLDDLGEVMLHILIEDFGFRNAEVYLLDPEEDRIRKYVSLGDVSEKETPYEFAKKVEPYKIMKDREVIRIPITTESLLGWIETTDLKISEDFKEFLTYAKLAVNKAREYEILRNMAFKNGLTKLLNYRGYMDKMEKLMEEVKQNKKYLSIAIIDMDDLRGLNDEIGHPGANIVIKELGGIFSENVRKKDYVCRFGGDEFCVIMPDTEEKEAYCVLENLRNVTVNHTFPLTKRKITFSAGLAIYGPNKTILDTEEKLKKAADSALYKAKEHGKNLVYIFNEG